MKKRKLQRYATKDTAAWICSACGWARPLPRFVQTDDPDKEMQGEFDAHKCADHPKKKTREDFSQAAVRIVREATKD
jgi:hypothetical protein